MNPNFNQQFNYQASSNQFNQSSNFDFQAPGPSFLTSNEQSFNSISDNKFNNNSFGNTFGNSFGNHSSTNTFSNSKQSPSKNQFDNFGINSTISMGENMFIQSSSSITPINSPFDTDSFEKQNYQDEDYQQSNYQDTDEYEQQSNYQDEDDNDLVQNYGVRNSDVYIEKRKRNNLAVRKARAKFTKKNKELVERVEVLKEENKRLLHKKEIVQGRFNEVKDIYDSLFK